MIKWFKKLFHNPTDREIAQRELEEARLELLLAESGKDYAVAMMQYHLARIARLENMLKEVRNGHN